MIKLAPIFPFPRTVRTLRSRLPFGPILCRSVLYAPVLLVSFATAVIAHAQTSDSNQQPSPRSQPPIQPVTTTVVVQGHVSDDYLPTQLSVGSLDSLPLASAPVSATVVTRDLMNDQISRLLSDVVKNDASIGEDYAPVGYYGD